MEGLKKRKEEDKLEYLARLGVVKNLGVAALAAAGAVLIPPVGVPLAAVAVVEGLHGGGLAVAHQHLKGKRLKRESKPT